MLAKSCHTRIAHSASKVALFLPITDLVLRSFLLADSSAGASCDLRCVYIVAESRSSGKCLN